MRIKKQREKQYYCIREKPFFNQENFNKRIQEDIDRNTLFYSLSKKLKRDTYELFWNTFRNEQLTYEKKWMISAPEHAIVAAKLRGEI